MKWKKLGKIFDPTVRQQSKEFLKNGELLGEFAQSPQTLIFDDFIRIYFSTRERDQNGKFLSHIAFVDLDQDFKKIINTSKSPVIELGKTGCFDEHGIFPINILRNGDEIRGYTCGWSRRISVSVETSIGLAFSKDQGETFQKIDPGPVLSSSLHEPFLVGDAFVAIFENKFHMWYIFGTAWINSHSADPSDPAERIYKIAHAISDDGISWHRESKAIITDSLNSHECQALPSVIKHGDKYHMVFCYREATDFRNNKNRGYRLGYAYSSDLNNWLRDDKMLGMDFSENDFDSDMMCYPHIFHCKGKVYMLYNGNEFGRYGFGLAVLEAI